MEGLQSAGLVPGDLVAVTRASGPGWIDQVAEVWDAGAALFPVDRRLSDREMTNVVQAARPTLVLGPRGCMRRDDGLPADPGVVLVVQTSGTGGVPKLAQFDRPAVEAAVAASALALGATPVDPWLSCLPPSHVGGLLVILRALLLGAPVTVYRRFEVSAFVAERDAVFTSLVPTMLTRLLDAEVDLRRYRAILVGGAHLPEHLRAKAERAGANVIETYGLTESFGGIVYDGRPLSGVKVRTGDAGEIELSGPTLMLGYRSSASEATRQAFTRDGWLRSGDAGEIDGAGLLQVIGRLDDLIDSGGEKVWPEEVEAALSDHPRVRDVAVAGRLDREWGHRVVAFVVPADPEDPPTLEELRSFSSHTLPRYKGPRELVLVKDLPRTTLGKLRRVALAGE